MQYNLHLRLFSLKLHTLKHNFKFINFYHNE
jgi:hypothetical protein